MNHHLFVYGSLRKEFRAPAYQYISQYFSFVAKGKIKGMLNDMGDYPAATPFSADVYITGELYAVKNENEFSWVIGQLDDYEGLFPETEEREQALFRRELTKVFLENGEITEAWVYWYNGDAAGRPVIASGDVLEYFREKNNL